MASTAHPAGDNDVVVTLVATGRTQAGIPERNITLTRMAPTARVGRSSKVSAKACLAAENNAWFETPVMSRDHAELTADFDNKTIAIKDVGSLHGTFIRHKATPQTEDRVAAQTSVTLENGDQIRFGIDIHRHAEKFPPCVVDFDTTWHSLPELAKKSPNTFSVPYGSDDEDQASDTDSVIVMEQNLPAITKKSNITIDLTTAESSTTPQRTIALAPSSATLTRGTVVDLTSEPDVDDISMMARYSPVPSSRRSLSTSPASHAEPMLTPAGLVETPQKDAMGISEWTDIESEEDSDSNSQLSEDPENLPLVDEDDDSIMSDDSARYTSPGDESDDSMSDSEMESYDEESGVENYGEDGDEEEGHTYDWDFTRPQAAPVNAVQDVTVVTEEQNSDSLDEDMASDSDEEESVFDEKSPASTWDKKSSPLADPHESLGWPTPNPNSDVHYGEPYLQSRDNTYLCGNTYLQSRYMSQRQPSPSDAAMVKKHTPATEASSTTANALGLKTGKFEYFEARDHNRSLAVPSVPTILDHEPMSSFYNTAWTGDDFINRPQPSQQLESLEDRTKLQSPEPLDMTSAFTYQQSKSMRRIPIPDLLAEEAEEPSPAPAVVSATQETPSLTLQPASRPPKRGIDEISDEIEEDAAMVGSNSVAVPNPAEAVPVTLGMVDNEVTRVSERHIEYRPTKRRRLAEFAACVTLGGAAVLAGLITTAPQFA